MPKCPQCGAELQLVLQLVEPPQALKVVTIFILGVEVSNLDIMNVARTLKPKPFDKRHKYSVSLEALSGRVEDFPTKQIVRAVLTTKKSGIGCPSGTACAGYVTKLGFEVNERPRRA